MQIRKGTIYWIENLSGHDAHRNHRWPGLVIQSDALDDSNLNTVNVLGITTFILATNQNKRQYLGMLKTKLKNEIIARLSPQKPLKVIIFGSQAWGGSGEGSDIDLILVLNKAGIPSCYREKTENFLEVSRRLRDLNKKMAMDLVVMTRTQWEQFIEMDSAFAREVQSRGLPLI